MWEGSVVAVSIAQAQTERARVAEFLVLCFGHVTNVGNLDPRDGGEANTGRRYICAAVESYTLTIHEKYSHNVVSITLRFHPGRADDPHPGTMNTCDVRRAYVPLVTCYVRTCDGAARTVALPWHAGRRT